MSNSEEEFFENLAHGAQKNQRHKTQTNEENHEIKMHTEKENEIGPETEGKLTVDVYQTPNEIIVESAIAGVKPDELDINVSADSVTIRGERRHEEKIKDEDYFYQECYWGRFSRSIILPEEVNPDGATVNFKNGVLTVKLPKISKKEAKKLKVKVE